MKSNPLLSTLIGTLLLVSVPAVHAESSTPSADRTYMVKTLVRIVTPVLDAGAAGELKKRLPVHDFEKDRGEFTHLEAVGRSLAGIAPWLELGTDNTPEGQMRGALAAKSVRTIASITDPASPDYCNFTRKAQPLVDTAFLAHALLRAPKTLWSALNAEEQARVVTALKASRVIKPFESNWLLFSATIEAALWRFTGECNREAIAYALEKHDQWYKGDGSYGDGPDYRWDYYNSFVIQPMMLAVLDVCVEKNDPLSALHPRVLARAQRYAVVQEHLISPEGTFPVIGRSCAYRLGAFQHLADVSLRRKLPKQLNPAAVRSALTAVARRLFEAPGTFDENGFLRIGVAGHQPSHREGYIATGSLYLCLTGFVHLGLPPDDPLWTAPAAPWTQARIWSGEDMPADRAYKEEKKK